MRGWLSELEPRITDLGDFRRKVRPNLCGDVAYDYDEWGDAGIPRGKADVVWHAPAEVPFDEVGYLIGPEEVFAETFG